jgi:hypothetical protein
LNGINKAIGELLNKISPKPSFDPAPHQRMPDDFFGCRFDAGQERFPQARLAVFIESGSIPRFQQGFRVKE